jgi:hypothetical protein
MGWGNTGTTDYVRGVKLENRSSRGASRTTSTTTPIMPAGKERVEAAEKAQEDILCERAVW